MLTFPFSPLYGKIFIDFYYTIHLIWRQCFDAGIKEDLYEFRTLWH